MAETVAEESTRANCCISCCLISLMRNQGEKITWSNLFRAAFH
uniref:Uncharacterized protein n=1 Tax=Anguilla anguilla TaxID=7936 RepID=A0A0E9W1J3_ANGAN